jgi:prepilin-type N-terminal cleavage/methylation domain-containing protein
MNMNINQACVRRMPARFLRPAMSLLEMLLALTILAVVSTAVVAMLHGGAQVSSALGSSISNQWEVESAITRIIQQTRMCTALTVPNGTSGGTTFNLVTQPDAANGNLTYTVSYALVTAADGTRQLQETDPRYGTSILIRNVQSFSIRTKNVGPPQVAIVTLTVGTTPPVTRTFRVTPRNQ